MAFTVGQKVVCVDDGSWSRGCWDGDGPVLDAVYTIRRYFTNEDGDAIVWLEEIKRSALSRVIFGDDVGYGAFRFRPLVSRKTDISIFHEILDRVNSGETELVE